VVLIGVRLGAVEVDLIGTLGAADRLEEHLREASEGAQPRGVQGRGLVEGLDEKLAEELGDVLEVEEEGIAAGAAAGGRAALAAAVGEQLLVAGVVEEAEVAAGQRTGGAGAARAGGSGAAGFGHGQAPVSGVQVFRRSGVQVFGVGCWGRRRGAWRGLWGHPSVARLLLPIPL